MALTWRTTPTNPALLFVKCPPLSRPLHPCLHPPFLHFSHLDSILGFLFTASVFQSPVLPLFLYSPLSRCTIYHSLPPSHLSLSLLPSLCLSLLRFSSGSPLIKPPCLLPPCPVSTHASHTSLFSLFVSYLCPSFSLPYFYHTLMNPSS